MRGSRGTRQPLNQDDQEDHSAMNTFCENIKHVPNESNKIDLKWYEKRPWLTKDIEQLFCILKCEYMYIPDYKF